MKFAKTHAHQYNTHACPPDAKGIQHALYLEQAKDDTAKDAENEHGRAKSASLTAQTAQWSQP